MRVHAIKAGSISVKRRYVEAEGRMRITRLTNSLLDTVFRTVPVYTWAIEHPEGVIVIDTGLTARANDPEYFPVLQRPFWRSQYRFHITPEEEIGPQLEMRGIRTDDVRWLVITHAHFDHTEAMYHFPKSEVVFLRKEWEDIQRWRSTHFAFPSKWPDWLRPRLIDYVPEPIGPFAQSCALTNAGDVRLIPTPGHTMGHQSVILQENDRTLFFAADASFDLPSLLDGTLDAPAFNSHVDLATRQKILRWAEQTPLVYLATHDPETETRLAERATILLGAVELPH